MRETPSARACARARAMAYVFSKPNDGSITMPNRRRNSPRISTSESGRGDLRISCAIVPVYSGYMSMAPFLSASKHTIVPPRPWMRCTSWPFFSTSSAIISATR